MRTERAKGWIAWALAGVVGAAALLGLLVPNAIRSAESFRAFRAAEVAEPDPMLAVAPGGTVSLEQLPAGHADVYRSAADHPEVFHQVRCYCGCEAFLDHRDLLACFLRPEDGAWERHATGCAVCMAEAEEVLEGIRDGDTTAQVARRIDDRYGNVPVRGGKT